MWTTAWTLLPALLLLCPLKGYAANFTFAYGAAGQCDDFQVSWSGMSPLLPPLFISPAHFTYPGGTAPYQLTLAHVRSVYFSQSDLTLISSLSGLWHNANDGNPCQ